MSQLCPLPASTIHPPVSLQSTQQQGSQIASFQREKHSSCTPCICSACSLAQLQGFPPQPRAEQPQQAEAVSVNVRVGVEEALQ